MSSEAQVRSSLQVRIYDTTGTILLTDYRPSDTFFTADVSSVGGPTPGSFSASIHGTDVDLSHLTAMGGLCRVKNQDPTNFVTLGIWNSAVNDFFPLMELLPGESYVVRLSRSLQKLDVGTGTYAASSATTLQIRADTAACQVLVEAFEP